MKETTNSPRGWTARLFDFSLDKTDENEVIQGIRNGVRFKGANLLILIIAIFIASIGLNINSTAIVIGAMLISPLMGPIIGMGLGVGISDFDLFKQSVLNLLIAAAFSILTATIYFLITPISEAQSELLSRTSPTIFDVFTAICGGLAGIVALSCKEKGNVLPGVAIATALMPPLCTVGYGLATANWLWAMGALYLFFINTVFIATATFIGVRIMNFKRKVFMDKQRELKVRHILITISILTMTPATILTYLMVKEVYYKTDAQAFIAEQLDFPGTQIIASTINAKDKQIRVALIGNEVSRTQIEKARSALGKYKLQGTELGIMQEANGDSATVQYIHEILNNKNVEAQQYNTEVQTHLTLLQNELDQYKRPFKIDPTVTKEMQVFFPKAESLTLGMGLRTTTGNENQSDTIHIAVIKYNGEMNDSTRKTLNEWIRVRTRFPKLEVIIH